ncbi:acyltransferase family protein [Sphingomonas bacterium]|uniref:acyltransferase family protein n=1 Tax=Sphingomonas bacterium TaxID=1895847 RepID=UPI0015775C70|nr:hypothetical protein [Sphingomonas bacterium]
MQATFTPICLGIGLAALLDDPAGYRRAAALLASTAALPVIAVAIACLIVLAPPDIAGAPRLGFQLLSTALIGAVVLRPTAPMVRVLEGRVVARVGVVSYGMYLYHLLALHIAAPAVGRAVGPSEPVIFLFTAVLAYGLAEISFKLMEQPILRASRRFVAPGNRAAAALSAEA